MEESFKIQHGSERKNVENVETSAKISAATSPDDFPPKGLEEQSEIPWDALTYVLELIFILVFQFWYIS